MILLKYKSKPNAEAMRQPAAGLADAKVLT